MSPQTIFDKIINDEIPSDKVYSDDLCIAFRDIQPQAPVHILVIPRCGIESLKSTQQQDINLLGHLLFVSSKVAKEEGLDSWRTIINTGEEAGQTVFHLHIHLIAGREFTWPPG